MSYSGLGQTKPGAVDNTARDVGTAVNVGGSLIGGLIGAATGRPPATTETATTPEPYVPDVEAPGGGYFWPVAIGVGVLVIGGVAWMGMQTKLPKVAANRRRRVRKNRLTPRQRAALPKSAFVFPARRAWPLDTPERAYAAIQLLKLGRMGSASDFAKVRTEIMRRYPQVWSMYGRNLSWEKTKRAHAKGIAHRKTSRRKTSRRAA